MAYGEIWALNPQTLEAEMCQTADADRLNAEARRCRINNVRLKFA